MDFKERLDLVKRNTQEILVEDELVDLLKNVKNPKSYLGIATTGQFHMGYFVPLGKMLDFDRAGIKNTLLIADIHAALDDLKCKWEELDLKADYYKKCVELGFPWENKPEFVEGSSFQLRKEYQYDVLRMSTILTVSRATRAASEVTRMKNPKVSELIYPIMQALDEQYLETDIQLGGIDQRHILAMAREYLPQVGYKKRVEIMTPLVVSLRGPGVKMSASIPDSHIKIYEDENSIKNKINKAYCPEGIIDDNPILQLYKYVLFPIKQKIKIERDIKFGGDTIFNNYSELEKVFVEKKLHPVDIKQTLTKHLIEIFKKIREYFDKNKDLIPKFN